MVEVTVVGPESGVTKGGLNDLIRGSGGTKESPGDVREECRRSYDDNVGLSLLVTELVRRSPRGVRTSL